MVNLTFGEQVKIILSRKGMTIKELAELMEQHTGKSMSRQNMTQRLGRDNFQEQDMRMIAKILGCRFQLSIMEMEDVEDKAAVAAPVKKAVQPKEKQPEPLERDVTVGDLVRLNEELQIIDPEEDTAAEEEIVVEKEPAIVQPEPQKLSDKEREMLKKGIKGYFRKTKTESNENEKKQPEIVGDVNPYTGKEYQTNSVRMHPKRIGYVQVYDQELHKWTDMTEWAFLGYEERKKVLQGKDYQPPIYLD